MNDPTLGEVMRELARVSKQLEAIATEMRQERESNKRDYIARVEYEADREGDDRRFIVMEAKHTKQDDFRRQVMAGFIIGLLLLLVPVIGAIASLRG